MAFTIFAFNQVKAVELEPNEELPVENQKMELIQNDVKIDDPDIEPINTKDVKNVVPDTKKEGKKVIMLFLKAMFTVFICAVALFFLLAFIKKNWADAFKEVKTEQEFEALDLSSPNNKLEALKSFLNRTK